MKPQEVIAEHLHQFVLDKSVKTIIDNCVTFDGASWLNSQIKLTITQSTKNKIVIEICNNARDGFTEFKKEYTI